MIGVVAVAACEAMFEMTREYAKERHAFGKPIISKQVGVLATPDAFEDKKSKQV